MTISTLIIENNPAEDIYKEVLGKYSTKVSFFSKLDDALNELDCNISLIFFEHDGKKRDAFSFLRQNREKIKDALTVILTKNPDVKDAVAFMKEGAFDYLSKPLEKKTIESFVHFLLEAKKKNAKKPKLKQNQFAQEKKIISNSSKFNEVIAFCRRVARGKSTVLIQGESGTGKELISRLIHQESPRAGKPFVAVNCAAFPEGLLESELFGHQKGAFTGAIEKKIGKMELADGGTILFDEIGEMAIQLQAKLLRAIQERQIDPVGGKNPIPVDIRILATTNRDLKKEIKEKRFREDLYYRLNVISIQLPSLRERKEDIPVLTEHFLEKHCHNNELEKKTISNEVINILKEHDWPGNVRELENVIERAVIISQSSKIEEEHIFLEDDFSTQQEDMATNSDHIKIKSGVTMAEMEKKLILKTLQNVQNNRLRAAEMLGIHVRTLRNKLNEYKKEGVV